MPHCDVRGLGMQESTSGNFKVIQGFMGDEYDIVAEREMNEISIVVFARAKYAKYGNTKHHTLPFIRDRHSHSGWNISIQKTRREYHSSFKHTTPFH